MSKKKKIKNRCIAIIGGGPRGTSALESLYLALSKQKEVNPICTLLFEATDNPGGGKVYDLKQSDANWLNISERALELPARPAFKINKTSIPAFPSYHDWAALNYENIREEEPDVFPARSKLGLYLKERYQSISQPLEAAGWLTVIQAKVEQFDFYDHQLEVVVADGTSYQAEEVLLTIGHQSTDLSPQLEKWDKYAKKNEKATLFTHPYPLKQFTEKKKVTKKSIIALRGFGLAMIDVARGLLEEKGGKFILKDKASQSYEYKASKKTPTRLVPFSLDGLPAVPKPLNARIDNWFKPTTQQLHTFCERLKAANQEETEGNYFLILAIAKLTASIFINLEKRAYPHELSRGDVKLLIAMWLSDQNTKHDLYVPHDQATEKMMQAFVNMAIGQTAISLDYCIGQVWRHVQPSIYELLSYSDLKDEVMADVIALDERIKRYSYGPPVASIQQMLALIKAKVLDMTFINNPDIKLTKKGWQLQVKDAKVTADVMINSVLNPPRLLAVNTALIRQLLADDLIQPIHDKLGVVTDENAYIQTALENETIPMAMLGRLTKGTVIGVDAILECFGLRSEKWAEAAVKNYLGKS